MGVRALGASGNSIYSSTVNGTTTYDENLPLPAESLISTPLSETEVELSWTDNANNETGYEIERSPDGETFTVVASIGANATSYTENDLKLATLYYYRVRPFNDYSTGSEQEVPYTAIVEVITLGVNQAPTMAVLTDQNNCNYTDDYLRTQSPEYLGLVKEVYKGSKESYSNFDWNDVKTVNDFIYDDMMWWIIALARGHEIIGDPEYLDNAISGFKFVWEEAFDPVDGGMRWSWKVKGKNACINYPTIIAAMYLYNITGEDAYLAKAKNIYSWSRKNLFESTTGRVADHIVGNNPPGFEDYTYNQGVCIGAAVMLYKVTESGAYLSDARLAAEYTRKEMSDNAGILPAEGDWNEQGVLKAIFARYLYMFIEEEGQEQYVEWLRKNAALAWSNRDVTRNLMFRDYSVKCPEGDFQSYEASSAVGIMQVCPPGP